MHYFDAVVLTILGLVNNLHCVEILPNVTNLWPTSARAKLEISPQFVTGIEPKLILRGNNESLNMTCTAVHQNPEKSDTSLDYVVDWKVPSHVRGNPSSKITTGQDTNIAWLWFEHLSEYDAGDYICNAVTTSKAVVPPFMSNEIRLSVKSSKSKPTFCGKQWFKCHSSTICIMQRYVCDGKADCLEGEDENPEACGPDPCFGKVHCEGRCIPPEWCCDHRNCSGTYGLRPWPPETHEISYVQTAFYTVIGCAMAFMFIVTILVIAICRVQIKRAMNSRWTQQNRTNCTTRRAVPVGIPMYDLDVYLNRTADNYPRGVSIMYNINSGVQFVGRPVEPPPYSEVIASPPREGPPPPYVSCENLIEQTTTIGACESTTSQSEQIETSTCDATPLNNDLREESSGFSGVVITSRSIPGPQVPTVSHISTNNSSAVNSASRPRLALPQSFDLEYVETDALLSENSNITIASPKETLWKSYGRPGGAKARWQEESPDKRWFRRKSGKSAESSPLKSKDLSLADAENEGVFLDTDQQEGRQDLCQEPGPSTSALNNEQISISGGNVVAVDDDDERVNEFSGDGVGSSGMDNSALGLMTTLAFSVQPSQPQNTLTDTHAQINESSTSMSTTLVSSSDQRTETNGQMSASEPLVLPLRESFIGVQKNS
ncbi:uncharacterized protein LOC107044715 isoform X2 [Diachasma alloeum]|uniref:uncharacterized protein LOC107044715 isoform X2 n=1 Tax=Diachasma alloeum TaxID=454923 RepID=UPI0007384DC6|nr:uncharacterized protein LOC107044715 isoform X2 [Diachasma alloeum]